MSTPKTRSQSHEITIDASPEAVWQAITEADELVRWFVKEARVTPQPGGSYWLSWGPGEEGEQRIEVFEPGKRLRLIELTSDGKPGQLVAEYTLDTRHGKTVLRLVMSGIPEGADWDAFYDGTDIGWKVFFETLRHYVEAHRGERREHIHRMGITQLAPQAAFERLIGPQGLAAKGKLEGVKPGDRYQVTTANGDELKGRVRLWIPGKGISLTVANFSNAILSATFHQASQGTYAFVTLSIYGAESSLDELRSRWEKWLGELYGLA